MAVDTGHLLSNGLTSRVQDLTVFKVFVKVSENDTGSPALRDGEERGRLCCGAFLSLPRAPRQPAGREKKPELSDQMGSR